MNNPNSSIPNLSKEQIDEINSLHNEIEKSKQSLLKMQNELETCSLANMDEFTIEQKAIMDDLQNQLLQNQSKMDEIRLNINYKEKQMIELQECNRKLTMVQSKYDDLIGMESKTIHEIESLQQQIEEYQTKIIEMNTIKTQIQNMKELRQGQNKESIEKTNEEFISKLKQDIILCESKLASSLEKINKEVTEQEQKYSDLLQENEQLENELKSLQNTLRRQNIMNMTSKAAEFGYQGVVWAIPKIWTGIQWAVSAPTQVMIGGHKLTKYMYNLLYGSNTIFEQILKFQPKNVLGISNFETNNISNEDLYENNKNIRIFFEVYPEYGYVEYICNGIKIKAIELQKVKNAPDEMKQYLTALDALKKANELYMTDRENQICMLYERTGYANAIEYTIDTSVSNEPSVLRKIKLGTKEVPAIWFAKVWGPKRN